MASRPLVILNIAGLTPKLLGSNSPHLNTLIRDGFCANIEGVFPALTCSAQASMLTGLSVRGHGIVGNGWYFRDQSEIRFWHQSNHLVQGEKVWETARRLSPSLSCAQLFWWFNMYASVEWSVTPRPIYTADGRKIPALYTHPETLQQELEQALGPFPFFHFWGPKADIESSRWIAECARKVFDDHNPGILLVYLPHLDYNLQRLGPNDPHIHEDIQAIDAVAGRLINHCKGEGADILVVSEYGIESVTQDIRINVILRSAGLLSVRNELGREQLDPGASRAFAVTDHQIAHIYIANPCDIAIVKKMLESTPGIEYILDLEGKTQWNIDHPRSGELVAVAASGYWFSYYFWLNDQCAPDYAKTVDIHRKPGYDPVELFLDPELKHPRLHVAKRLYQKQLGMRMLMDVIPIKPELVKGSHGRLAVCPEQGPLLISSRKDLEINAIHITDIKKFILDHRA